MSSDRRDTGRGAIVVEVVGTPGAGKSTTASELVSRLRAEGIDAATMTDTAREHAARTPAGMVATRLPNRARRAALWAVFRFMREVHARRFRWTHARLFRHVAEATTDADGYARRTRARTQFAALCGGVEFLRATSLPGEVLVLDDGFLHRAVHLHASPTHAAGEATVRAFVDLLPAPELAVYVTATPAHCGDRVRRRGVWAHAREMTDEELDRYLEHANAVTRLAVARAHRRGWTVLHLDNDGASVSGAALNRAVDTITQMCRERVLTSGERTQCVVHVPRPARVRAQAAAQLTRPALDDAVVRDVLAQYGLRPLGDSRALRLGRRSTNAVVATDAGMKTVKRYRPHWSTAAIASAHSVLVELERQDFPAVRLTRNVEGATWTELPTGAFAVFDFVEGTNYSTTYLRRHDRLRLTATAGRTLAQLQRALGGFVPDGSHHLGFVSADGPRVRDAAWHAAKLDELARRRARLRPEASATAAELVTRRSEITERITALEERLADVGLPRCVVHGDFGLHNLLYRRDGGPVVLDFENTRLDWRVNDLVSALGKYKIARADYDTESMQVFARAYLRLSPLGTEEYEHFAAAWELYRLRAAVQYCNSYFETDGPLRKLRSAVAALGQADLVARAPELVTDLLGPRPVEVTAGSGLAPAMGASR